MDKKSPFSSEWAWSTERLQLHNQSYFHVSLSLAKFVFYSKYLKVSFYCQLHVHVYMYLYKYPWYFTYLCQNISLSYTGPWFTQWIEFQLGSNWCSNLLLDNGRERCEKVVIDGMGDKCQVTATFAGTLSGKFLPIQIKVKQNAYIPIIGFQKPLIYMYGTPPIIGPIHTHTSLYISL